MRKIEKEMLQNVCMLNCTTQLFIFCVMVENISATAVLIPLLHLQDSVRLVQITVSTKTKIK